MLVSIEYRIPARHTHDFARAAQPLCRLRLRNGAERWLLFRDVSSPEIRQELFLVDNQVQHLHMLDRMTLADRIVINNVTALHAGDGPSQIRHCVSYGASSYDTPLVKSATPPANDEAGATARS